MVLMAHIRTYTHTRARAHNRVCTERFFDGANEAKAVCSPTYMSASRNFRVCCVFMCLAVFLCHLPTINALQLKITGGIFNETYVAMGRSVSHRVSCMPQISLVLHFTIWVHTYPAHNRKMAQRKKFSVWGRFYTTISVCVSR